MLLLLMRHGIAIEREEWDGEEEARPLTKDGFKKTRRAARGLHECVEKVHLIAASPLLRARQTAEIAREVFKTPLSTWPELKDAEYSALLARLKTLQNQTVILIGHEPGLSQFAAKLLCENENGFGLEFKKAGVCALELDVSTRIPRATLLWHATPKMLGKMR